jgi:hypothetical protein
MSYLVIRVAPDGSREPALSNPHESRSAAEQHAERLLSQERSDPRARFEVVRV